MLSASKFTPQKETSVESDEPGLGQLCRRGSGSGGGKPRVNTAQMRVGGVGSL